MIIDRLIGDEPTVLVEGAAGCGKTHTTVTSASRCADQLAPWQEVLLLTHTNAARDVFRDRLSSHRQVSFQTLDAFACAVVGAYAQPLGVEHPLRPNVNGHPSFDEIRRLAVRLVREAPGVRRAIAARYPIIFVDEHQDSSVSQHDLVSQLSAEPGVRLRLFGDRLQAIYDFGEDELVDWETLLGDHSYAELTTPRRWTEAPRLGLWLAAARQRLLAGMQVSLQDCPPEVAVHRWDGRAPGPGQRAVPAPCAKQLMSLHGCAILVRNNPQAIGIATRTKGTPMYEGADTTEAAQFLEEAQEHLGSPTDLIDLLLRMLGTCGTGMPPSIRSIVMKSCDAAGVKFGRHQKLRPLLELCAELYAVPTPTNLLVVLRLCFLRRTELEWRPYRYGPLLLLTDRRLHEAEDPVEALPAIARRRSEGSGAWRPKQFVSTIHRVKGAEHDVVALPYCSADSFPDSPSGRRHLYVAMTRARKQLHLFIPTEAPTPLLAD